MQIEAKIIADSISSSGKRLTTFCLVYPRIIHAELLTHKMLSKNSASSRAIPVSKVIEMVRGTPARPSRFGANQAGMQDKGENHEELIQGYTPQEWWRLAALSASRFSETFNEAGYHKQVCNRITEPYQWMKTVLTGTEFANFFWLRNHKDADPTLQVLAREMYVKYTGSFPTPLKSGEWHLPYYEEGRWKSYTKSDGGLEFDIYGRTLEEAISISMSCCAQVSYRTLDDSFEKAQKVVSRLNLDSEDDPKHSSPAEHQGTPIKQRHLGNEDDNNPSINIQQFLSTWEKGITAYHKELGFMSGNLAGFIQYRQLIEGNTRWG